MAEWFELDVTLDTSTSLEGIALALRALYALLEDRPQTGVAGHTHVLDVASRDGHHYVSLGTTGGLRGLDGPGDIHRVVLARFRNGQPELEIVRYEDGIERLPLSRFVSSTIAPPLRA